MARSVRFVKSTLGHTLESVADRSLFIRVQPPPANLTERRAVLHALQRHGEVDMFKKLADNASFVSIASTASMAAKLVDRSPMTIEFVADKNDSMQPWASPAITAPIQPIETKKAAAGGPKDLGRVSQKSFVLSIYSSGENYKHKTIVRRAPLHGPWPNSGDEKNTFVYNALKEVVPDSLGAEGLCDWHTGGQLSDDARIQRSEEEQAVQEQIGHVVARKHRSKRAIVEPPVIKAATSDES